MTRGGGSRMSLTRHQKLQLCTKKEKEPACTAADLPARAQNRFKLLKRPGISTVRRVLKEKAHLAQLTVEELARKRVMAADMGWLDEHVIQVMALYEGRVHLCGRVILQLARLVAEILGMSELPLTRSGWLRHFQARYGIRKRRSYGESDSVARDVVAAATKTLRQQIGQYHPNDVFNVDEAAYFYRSIPRYSICLNAAPALKQSKARVSIVVGANSTGTEKLPLMVLGAAKTSRWLAEKPEGVQSVGARKGWMTVEVFQKWLRDLNESMKKVKRKILLLYDNAPVHIEPEELLSNIKVLRLPENTTAVMQPMDQGVIAWLKSFVLSTMTDFAVSNLLGGIDNPYNVSIQEAVQWLDEAWDQMSSDTIHNCWKHSGLFVDRLAVGDIIS